MKLIGFYKKILSSMGMDTDKGFIKTGKELVMIDGKPLVLPLKEQLETIQAVGDDGRPYITKVLFNPLKENLVTGDSKALNKLKNIAAVNSSLAFYMIGDLLLQVAETNNVKEAPLEVQNFLTKLNEARTPQIKNLVDAKTRSLWSELFDKSLTSSTPPIKLFLKKGVHFQGEKYNRGLVITSPLLDEMKNGEFMDIKVRNKEMKIFIILTEYILDVMTDDGKKDANVLSITNHGQSPGLIALLKGYLKLMDSLNSKLRMLEFIDSAVTEDIMEVEYTYDDIESIDKYANELAIIPDISDTGEITEPMREVTKQDIVQQARTTDYRPTERQGEQVTGPVVEESDEDKMRRLLYGGAPQMVQPGTPGYGGGMPGFSGPPQGGYPPVDPRTMGGGGYAPQQPQQPIYPAPNMHYNQYAQGGYPPVDPRTMGGGYAPQPGPPYGGGGMDPRGYPMTRQPGPNMYPPSYQGQPGYDPYGHDPRTQQPMHRRYNDIERPF